MVTLFKLAKLCKIALSVLRWASGQVHGRQTLTRYVVKQEGQSLPCIWQDHGCAFRQLVWICETCSTGSSS
jgi:hypothetical protein